MAVLNLVCPVLSMRIRSSGVTEASGVVAKVKRPGILLIAGVPSAEPMIEAAC